MHRIERTKPDGRRLLLYARAPLDAAGDAPSPFAEPLRGAPHLRWHPLRGEWVTYAAHRQDRTFLPPPEYDPLAPTRDAAHPTELPGGDWEVAVFDNRFPALAARGDAPPPAGLSIPVAPGGGHCEVVVFTQDAQQALTTLPLHRFELLLAVLADRCADLSRRADVAYVLPFENRGAEVGVTLHHPHGQIYAYPVLPPVPATMARVAAEHHRTHGCGPLAALIEAERRDGARVLYAGEHAIAFVPPCARYPYEAWVAPIEEARTFEDLSPAQRADLARAWKTVLMKYDGLWARPMPYLMGWYPAPVRDAAPGWHLHAQFHPVLRSRERLKFLAGTEIFAGLFAMDVLPEATAAQLQAVAAVL